MSGLVVFPNTTMPHSEIIDHVQEWAWDNGGNAGYRAAGLPYATPLEGAGVFSSEGARTLRDARSVTVVSDRHAQCSSLFLSGTPAGMTRFRQEIKALQGYALLASIADTVIATHVDHKDDRLPRVVPRLSIVTGAIAAIGGSGPEPPLSASTWEFGPETGSEVFVEGDVSDAASTVCGVAPPSTSREPSPGPEDGPPGWEWRRQGHRIAWFAPFPVPPPPSGRPSTPPPPPSPSTPPAV